MATPEAAFVQCGDTLDYTPDADRVTAEVIQLADGRAGAMCHDVSSGVRGAVQTEGVFKVLKTASIVFLDGGEVYWDHSANAAHFRKVNDRDFFIGTAVGDAASADTTLLVNFNVAPTWTLDAMREAVLSVPTGTAAAGGFGYPVRLGGAAQLELTATSEAQCVDILTVDRVAVGANPIVQAIIRPVTNGSGAAVDFSIGLANGTSTTDADAVTEHVFFHIDGSDTKIYAQSKDGTTTVSATDTTTTITAGSAVANRKELWIDARDISSVKLYVDGVRVLSGTTFVLSAATGPLGLLAHIEKTSGTTTGKFLIDALRARIAQM